MIEKKPKARYTHEKVVAKNHGLLHNNQVLAGRWQKLKDYLEKKNETLSLPFDQDKWMLLVEIRAEMERLEHPRKGKSDAPKAPDVPDSPEQ